MAVKTPVLILFGVLTIAVSIGSVKAADPPPVADFGVEVKSAEDLVFRDMFKKAQAAAAPDGVVFGVNVKSFSALKGQGGSLAYIELNAGAENLPHWHQRATEFFAVLEGTVKVGVIDGDGKLFESTLQAGDVTFFPQGLFHFQRNVGHSKARALAFLNSENPGAIQGVRQLFLFSNADIQPALQLDDKTLDFLRKERVAPRGPAKFTPYGADVLSKCVSAGGSRKML